MGRFVGRISRISGIPGLSTLGSLLGKGGAIKKAAPTPTVDPNIALQEAADKEAKAERKRIERVRGRLSTIISPLDTTISAGSLQRRTILGG